MEPDAEHTLEELLFGGRLSVYGQILGGITVNDVEEVLYFLSPCPSESLSVNDQSHGTLQEHLDAKPSVIWRYFAKIE